MPRIKPQPAIERLARRGWVEIATLPDGRKFWRVSDYGLEVALIVLQLRGDWGMVFKVNEEYVRRSA
jgi:hypothetical protein